MAVVTDPIADMLTRIRNAVIAKLDDVDIPFSKLKEGIASILEEESYIKGYEVRKEKYVNGIIKIYLKYSKDKKSSLDGLKRISKPGLRVYASKSEVPVILGGMGTVILSTSKGVITGAKAKELKVGGEIICSVW